MLNQQLAISNTCFCLYKKSDKKLMVSRIRKVHFLGFKIAHFCFNHALLVLLCLSS